MRHVRAEVWLYCVITEVGHVWAVHGFSRVAEACCRVGGSAVQALLHPALMCSLRATKWNCIPSGADIMAPKHSTYALIMILVTLELSQTGVYRASGKEGWKAASDPAGGRGRTSELTEHPWRVGIQVSHALVIQCTPTQIYGSKKESSQTYPTY